MRISIIFIHSLFFFVFPPLLWSATPLDRAIEHFSSTTTLPVNVEIEEQFISTQGKVEHNSTLEATLFRTADNKILLVPHTGYANGEEIPKNELRQMSEILLEKDLHSSLFSSAARSQVEWRQEREIRNLGDFSCQRFSFTTEINGHRADGSAWLIVGNGLPLEVEWQFVDVPFKQDETTINLYRQKDSYRISADGQCNIVSTEITMSLQYTVFFVPYQGQLQRRMTFANHRKRQDLPLNSVADN